MSLLKYASLESNTNSSDLEKDDEVHTTRELEVIAPVHPREEIEEYKSKHGGADQALLSIIAEMDTSLYSEEVVTQYVTEFLQQGANAVATDSHGNTPLRLASKHGLVSTAKELLMQGADCEVINSAFQTPLEVAFDSVIRKEALQSDCEKHIQIIIMIMKEMDSDSVRKLFLASGGTPAKVNFHEVLSRPELREVQQAVLDAQVEPVAGKKNTYKVFYDLLEANAHGRYSHSSPSAYAEIAWKSNKEAVSHLSVQLLMRRKWRRYIIACLLIELVFYLIFMAALTFVLVLASRKVISSSYVSRDDRARLVFEVILLITTLINVVLEISLIAIWRLDYFRKYDLFFFNYLNVAGILLIVVTLVTRFAKVHFAGNDWEWITSSLTYVTFALRGLKYLLGLRSVGKYVNILVLVLKRDVIPFMIVFTVVLVMFTGSFYCALRAEVDQNRFAIINASVDSDNGSNITRVRSSLDKYQETMSFPLVFLTGVRMMVEGGSVIDYYGSEGFRWLGVASYMIFLWFVVIVLQSLLIAQISDSYANVQQDAQRTVAINRARVIDIVEQTGIIVLKVRKWFYRDHEIVTSEFIEKYTETLEAPESTVMIQELDKANKMITKQNDRIEELRHTVVQQKSEIDSKLCEILKQLQHIQDTQN